MDNQHKKIIGYRDLTEQEIHAMNDVKSMANAVGQLIELAKANPEFDQRWVAIAKTELQQGFMALVRAVAKPESF